EFATSALRSPASGSAAGQGQSGGQTGRERIGGNVAGSRRVRASRCQKQGSVGSRSAQAVAPQSGADLRFLGADALGSAGADLRPAQRRRASSGSREV